jgi:hypothetical protein
MPDSAVVREKNSASDRSLAGYGPDEVVQRVRPTEDFGYVANPHRGTATFQRFNGDPLNPGLTWDDDHGPMEFSPFSGNTKNAQYPDTTVSYCRWTWAALEPQRGKFRWDIIAKTLDAARLRGQTVQMRVQPWVATPIPSWYLELGGTRDPKDPKGADHNHPAYLKYWGEMIRAFGKRFDGHPGLESFDIAYGGAYGEGGGNATPATARKLVDVYLRSFRKTTLVSMLGTPGAAYASKWNHIGWRADCFGDMHDGSWPRGDAFLPALGVPDHLTWKHMYDAYPSSLYKCGLQNAWQTAPVTWETCWTVGYWIKQKWDLDFILEEGLRYHPTIFMPKSSFIPDEVRDKIDAFDRKLGYRFVLRQVMLPLDAAPGQKITFSAYVSNVGVAPIYRPYQWAFRFSQGKQERVVCVKRDIRTWLPGIVWFEDSLKFPREFRSGDVTVDVALVDPKTLKPRVQFAILERGADGWHPLTLIRVKTDRA